ncbi:MAG TPA: cytochrome b/b6 domain-containing protein, partial [Gammaproteobacteria bacterium]|nr:cytochrome b/b6 domain-containing protein [Gammaproteobacteria bacterium]
MEDTPLYGRTVWDPVLRIIHWWMAITVSAQFALGGMILGEDTLALIHSSVGYLFGASLLAR